MLVNVFATSNMTGEQVKIAGPVEAKRLSVDARYDKLLLDLDGYCILVESRSTSGHWERPFDAFAPYFSSPVVMPC